ncbi:MAG: amidohydrolase family protein [Verrucomicrobia bacterium]|nr:amidohydrolase family protein [Verrucomicrobiota bacterium]
MIRRDFLRTTANATLGFTGISAGSAEEAGVISIIDTHQHLWDLERLPPPWVLGAPPVLARSYVIKDYLAATEGLNIARSIYMEVDLAPKDQQKEAEHIIELSKSPGQPTVAAVISGRPESEEFANYITAFKGNPYIKGMRRVLHGEDTGKGHCLQPQFVKSLQLLGELGMSFDICIRPTELADAFTLAKQCPGTQFILDHCGNADPKAFLPAASTATDEPWHTVAQWKDDMGRLASLDNVVCKISGIIARAPKGWSADHLAPIINLCLDEFSKDRVVFGSDWPVCLLGGPLKAWVTALHEVISNRPAEEQKKLLHENAMRVYRLG